MFLTLDLQQIAKVKIGILQIAKDYKFYTNFIIKFIIFANRYKYIKKYKICLFKEKVLVFIKKALKV